MGTNNIPSTYRGGYILSSKGAEDLANAIILQAVHDYRHVLKHWVQNPANAGNVGRKKNLDRFFRSEWCQILTGVDMVEVARKLQKEAIERYDEKANDA